MEISQININIKQKSKSKTKNNNKENQQIVNKVKNSHNLTFQNLKLKGKSSGTGIKSLYDKYIKYKDLFLKDTLKIKK